MYSNTPVFNAEFDYHSICNTAQRYNDCMLGDEEDARPLVYVPDATGSPILPSMQRFLSEPERTLFMPSILEAVPQALHTLPEVPIPTFHYLGGSGYQWLDLQRLSSPTGSTFDSSYVSSEWSGRQESPLSSPYLDPRPYSPQQEYGGGVAYAYGGHPPIERHDSHSPGACVALHDVQKCADEMPETFAFSTEPVAYSVYGSYAQEGYLPIQSGEDTTTSAESYSTPGTDYRADEEATHQEITTPYIRRRRPQVSRSPSFTAQVSAGRISKRSSVGRRSSSHNSHGDDAHAGCITAGNRAFPCPLAIYGCTSTFGSKNEWKRHVMTQHMRLGFWRCDQCNSNNGEKKPNDFNRKDLFIQHVRRMHPVDLSASPVTHNKKSKPKRENTEEQLLQEAATRCYRHLRSPPEKSQCLFCDQHFRGSGSWDERMEHVGRHMETAKKDNEGPTSPHEWRSDGDAEHWFSRQKVIVDQEGELVLA